MIIHRYSEYDTLIFSHLASTQCDRLNARNERFYVFALSRFTFLAISLILWILLFDRRRIVLKQARFVNRRERNSYILTIEILSEFFFIFTITKYPRVLIWILLKAILYSRLIVHAKFCFFFSPVAAVKISLVVDKFAIFENINQDCLSQYWMLSKTGEIRRDESCLDYSGSDVILYPCHGSKGNQQWIYNPQVMNRCRNILLLIYESRFWY